MRGEDASQQQRNVAEQLRNGGTFINYRESHSDDKLYSDLDPRFPVDEYNDGEDIISDMEKYHQSIAACNDDSVRIGVPTVFAEIVSLGSGPRI